MTSAFYGQISKIGILPVSLLGSLIKQEMRSTAFGKIYIKNKKCRTKSVAIRPHLFDISFFSLSVSIIPLNHLLDKL